MSVQYSAVKWNRNKKVYDARDARRHRALPCCVLRRRQVRLAGPAAIGDVVLLMRALRDLRVPDAARRPVHRPAGPAGPPLPAAALQPPPPGRRHVPRRPGPRALAVGYYHGFGRLNPFVSLLDSNTNYGSLTAFPFEMLGLLALVILFLMAATSHDFWQKNLSGRACGRPCTCSSTRPTACSCCTSPSGALQSEDSVALRRSFWGLEWSRVIGSAPADRLPRTTRDDAAHEAGQRRIERGSTWAPWTRSRRAGRRSCACPAASASPCSATTARISAVTNVCAHQRGPLGEGKIIDGCITCPWHGWEYRPQDGQSPPPFDEKIATYRVRVEGRRILLNPEPLPPGTPVEPAPHRGTPRCPSQPPPRPGMTRSSSAGCPSRRVTCAFSIPVVAVLFAVAAVSGAFLAFGQRSPGTGTWDDDTPRPFEGVAYASPYAMIRVPGEKADDPPRTILLVEEGKFGAADRVRPFDGRPVRVRGTLLHREERWMLELAADETGIQAISTMSPEDEAALAPPRSPQEHGRVTLRGEIIDSKCYLGAMKPGGGKTHKACAALCLSGGVPPMFVTRDAAGLESYYLLTNPDGGPLGKEAIHYVGDPVELTGALEQQGDLRVLKVAAADIHRR